MVSGEEPICAEIAWPFESTLKKIYDIDLDRVRIPRFTARDLAQDQVVADEIRGD